MLLHRVQDTDLHNECAILYARVRRDGGMGREVEGEDESNSHIILRWRNMKRH